MIREISIQSIFTNDVALKEKYKTFNLSTYCVGEYFVRLLGKFKIGKIQKLVIECDENPITKITSYEDYSVQNVRRHINMNEYLELSGLDKKKWVLEIIVTAFEELKNYFEFSIDEIYLIADEIKKANYQNNYKLANSILNKSKEHSANLYVEFNVEDFCLFLEIYDKNNIRTKFVKTKKVEPNFANNFMFCKIKWIDDKTIEVIGFDKKQIKKVSL